METGGGSLPLEPQEVNQKIEKVKANQAEQWAKVVRQVRPSGVTAATDILFLAADVVTYK